MTKLKALQKKANEREPWERYKKYLPSIIMRIRGDTLIAEIRGKISSTGSNLSERLEDKLTGDFFGAMRYIPYDIGLKKILEQRILATGEKSDVTITDSSRSYASNVKFWPYHPDGELDVIIETDSTIIGIEVKYKSGLSSEDYQEVESAKYSKNQLIRELRIIKELSQSKNKTASLLFIAPQQSCTNIVNDVMMRFDGEIDIEFSYLTWESILEHLDDLKYDNEFYCLIVSDLIELLSKKKFRKFSSFKLQNSTLINETYFEYNTVMMQTAGYSFDSNLTINSGGYYEYK